MLLDNKKKVPWVNITEIGHPNHEEIVKEIILASSKGRVNSHEEALKMKDEVIANT